MTQRRVFVLNDGGMDYSPAAAYGELVFCTEGSINKNDVAQMYRQLNEFLSEADAHDYIMICSLATLCSVASAIMAANHGEVHFLVYQNGKYHVKDLIL